MRIGILGGTFNPPHKAHIQLMLNILSNRLVDKIIVLTTNNRYNKPELIDLNNRIHMLNLAIDNESIIVEKEDVCKRLNYTIDALDYYQNMFPKDEIAFIMGSDNLKEFNTWKNWEELIQKFSLIVSIRNDDRINELKEILPNANIKFINSVGNLSSSFLRNQIRENNDVSEYLHEKVVEYIQTNKLYK